MDSFKEKIVLYINFILRRIGIKSSDYEEKIKKINVEPAYTIKSASILDKERNKKLIEMMNNDYRVYTTMNNGWGDSISWLDFKEKKVKEFKYKIPRVGDILKSKMISGGGSSICFYRCRKNDRPK